MFLTPREVKALAERLYGCVVCGASLVLLRAYWQQGQPQRVQAVSHAPAQELVAVGWGDASSGSAVYVDRAWYKHHAEQAGSTALALARWLSILSSGRDAIQLCAFACDDASLVLVQQRPRPRLLAFDPPQLPA